jgi:hypothetical protein
MTYHQNFSMKNMMGETSGSRTVDSTDAPEFRF